MTTRKRTGRWYRAGLLLTGGAILSIAPSCSSEMDTGDGPAQGAGGGGAEAVAPHVEALKLLTLASPKFEAALKARVGDDAQKERDGFAIVHGARSWKGKAPEARIRMGAESPMFVEIGLGSDEPALKLRPVASIGAPGELDGGRVVFRDAYRSTDVVRMGRDGNALEVLVLRDEAAPRAFGWYAELGAGLLRAELQGDGAYLLMDEGDVPRVRVPAPVLTDAAGEERKLQLTWADGGFATQLGDGKISFPAAIRWGVEVIDPELEIPFYPLSTQALQIKPRVMVMVDTSGSMSFSFANNASATVGGDGDGDSLYTDSNGANKNYYPGGFVGGVANGTKSRLYGAKKAVYNAVVGGTSLDFGLMRYAVDTGACENTKHCSKPGTFAKRCNAYYRDYQSGTCTGAKGWTTWEGSCGTGGEGGQVLVRPSGVSSPKVIEWVDNVENFLDPTNSGDPVNGELRALGSTPLAGGVRSALTQWYTPIYDVSKNKPNCNTNDANCDPYLDCRPYIFVAMTDGEESCSGTPVTRVQELYQKNAANPVKTYVIGVSVTSTTLTNMAVQGGTGAAKYTASQADIQAAFADIAASAVKVEICNGADDNCNGLVDEGLGVYQECTQNSQCGSNSCNSGRCACTTNAQCASGHSCASGFCVPSCSVGIGECQATGVRKCSANGTQCCINDGKATCAPLVAGTPKPEICNGKDDNCNGIIDEGNVCAACQPVPETCNGKDDDCDGIIDNNLVDTGKSCGLNLGICKPGTSVCVNSQGQNINAGGTPNAGDHIECTGGVSPGVEVCNGLDDDCDGTVDGMTQTCYSGAAGTQDVGICRGGQRVCTAVVGSGVPAWGSCVGEVTPKAETCNGLDDNCNGIVDDVAGVGSSCCPAGNCGVGVCKSGINQCSGGTVQCIGAVGPSPEICDGLDNDCNGIIDDFAGGQVGATCCPSGKCGVGVCKSGVLGCGAGGLSCEGAVNPGVELCDGLDNDCNGLIDDIPGVGLECCPSGACGKGVCKAGVLKCSTNGLECDGSVGPSVEVCDGIDNDCNGIIDDVPGIGEPCCPEGSPPGDAPGACSKGVCKAGVFQCQDGAVACVGAKGPEKEICDGLDNNCDGQVDEPANVAKDDPSVGVACDVPNAPQDHPPCKAGTTACVGAKVVCEGAIKPSKEVCDGKDNDCDGVVDVGELLCPAEKQACVQGQCAAPCAGGEFPCPGGLTCQDGFCIDPNAGGGAGAAGNAGSAGEAGSGGEAGSAGNAGGSAGKAGSAGASGSQGGSSGQAGAAGSNGTDGQEGKFTFGLSTGGGGCSCDVAGNGSSTPWAGLMLGAAGVVMAARRRGRGEQ